MQCLFPFHLVAGWDSGTDGWAEGAVAVEQNAKHLRAAVGDVHGSRVLVLRACMSFPDGVGSHDKRRDVAHPDESKLVAAATMAGIGVRIIVTLRPATSVLEADCLHRVMERCKLQAETLIANAGYLTRQLRSLDQNKFRCVRYGDIDATISALTWGLGLAEEKVKAAVLSVWHPTSKSESLHKPFIINLVKGMEAAFLELESVCRK